MATGTNSRTGVWVQASSKVYSIHKRRHGCEGFDSGDHMCPEKPSGGKLTSKEEDASSQSLSAPNKRTEEGRRSYRSSIYVNFVPYSLHTFEKREVFLTKQVGSLLQRCVNIELPDSNAHASRSTIFIYWSSSRTEQPLKESDGQCRVPGTTTGCPKGDVSEFTNARDTRFSANSVLAAQLTKINTTTTNHRDATLEAGEDNKAGNNAVDLRDEIGGFGQDWANLSTSERRLSPKLGVAPGDAVLTMHKEEFGRASLVERQIAGHGLVIKQLPICNLIGEAGDCIEQRYEYPPPRETSPQSPFLYLTLPNVGGERHSSVVSLGKLLALFTSPGGVCSWGPRVNHQQHLAKPQAGGCLTTQDFLVNLAKLQRAYACTEESISHNVDKATQTEAMFKMAPTQEGNRLNKHCQTSRQHWLSATCNTKPFRGQDRSDGKQHSDLPCHRFVHGQASKSDLTELWETATCSDTSLEADAHTAVSLSGNVSTYFKNIYHRAGSRTCHQTKYRHVMQRLPTWRISEPEHCHASRYFLFRLSSNRTHKYRPPGRLYSNFMAHQPAQLCSQIDGSTVAILETPITKSIRGHTKHLTITS
ncbi:unnamed protein product [Mesocestoides corti]|uniref:PDZ domain-containing protein n=1 Tax=Mesocestoides corti TaxID=53468 RepID=A0A0R3U9S6_MESCO|nr:unnamed protein product [Mesocestoides corti]